MLSKLNGILTIALAVAMLSACSAMLMGEGGADSPPIGSDSRGSAQMAADEALTEAVVAALDAHSTLRPQSIAVSARSGAVTLGGTVGSFDARDLAVELATVVAGVASVNNQIRVKTSD